MPPKIVWLSDARQEAARVGTKAARLGDLVASGFAVPPGFCVPLSAYFDHLGNSLRSDLASLVRTRAYEAVRGRIMNQPISEEVRSEVVAASALVREQRTVSFAVRSSSTAEDLVGRSFAGLYETRLHLQSDAEILQAVKQCWSSYWDEEAATYRERAGIDHLRSGMGVLIQAMVQVRTAGVLFTRSPLHDDRSMVVEVVNDYGDRLVDGSVAATRLVIDRETRQVVSTNASPPILISPERLVSLGLRLEENQGAAQDIEWAVDRSDRLWVLQTRPVTGARRTSVRGLGAGWALSYEEPFSPLGCDIALKRYERWVKAINRHNRTSFKARMVEADGFLYYQPSWRSPALRRRVWTGFWAIYRFLTGTRIRANYLQTVLPSHLRRMNKLNSQNPSELGDQPLWAGFVEAVDAYVDFQETSYPMGALAATSATFLDLACRRFLRNPALRAVDLLSGLDNMSLRRDLALHSLGRRLNRVLSASEIEDLDYDGLRALARSGGGDWATALQDFVGTYGYVWADRYPRDPAWGLNQEAFLESLREAAMTPPGAGIESGHAKSAQMRLKRIAEQREKLNRSVLRRPLAYVFDFLLGQAEIFFPHKEDRNHYLYLSAMAIRKYANEIGRRLAQRGVTEKADDVFFLKLEEIERLAQSCAEPAELLRTRIEQRRSIFERSTARSSSADRRHRLEGHKSDADLMELRGEACSPGVAQGRARVIGGLNELHRVRKGDVLVCSQLRPAWTPVFARASAVVVEMGNLLSHGSTLAREYGIPAVFNVPELTRRVAENDWIIVDGHLGHITIRRRPD